MHCVVVGSGAAGMSTALLLARSGHAVTLVEKSRHLAPLLAGFSREGLHFDTGFHYAGGLHAGGMFRTWLKVLGLEQHLTFRPLNAQCAELFRFAHGFHGPHGSHDSHGSSVGPFAYVGAEGDYCLPTGHAAIAAAVEGSFPQCSSPVRSLLASMDELIDNSPYTNPRHTATGPLLHPPSGKSVADMLGPLHLPPVLQSMLSARCLLYGVAPHEAAWEDFAMVAAPYFGSAHSIVGGGKALVNAFVTALQAAKVRICTGVALSKLTVDAHTQLNGIELDDGTCLPCSACFFTGHPAQLAHILPAGTVRPAYLSRIRAMPESVPALMLFAESRSDFLDDRVCYLLGEPGVDTLFADLHTSPTPSVYLSASPPDPQGRRAIIAVSPLAAPHIPAGHAHPRSADYLGWKHEASESLTRSILQRCPELQGNFRVLDASTPQTLQHWVHGSQGGLYGLQHSLQYPPLLPLTRMPGLFLAGQNILLPGVLGAIISAALAVGFATEHAPILEVFRQCASNE